MPALNVCLVTPEYAPFLSWGGIATGLRSFGRALRRRGHRLTVAIPIAKDALENSSVIGEIGLDEIETKTSTPVLVGERNDEGSSVLLFGLPNELFLEAGYGPDVAADPSAARRCGLFCRAVAEWIVQENQSRPLDIVHAHEWPTAMVPYMLRERRANIRTVFTIHSLAYQGLFPLNSLVHFDLGPEHAQWDRLELHGRISLLKGALLAADRLTTVSPTYAREIQSPERGELLDGLLRLRQNALTGIVNGIDMNSWNPATDLALAERFEAANLAGKRICKESSCIAWGLNPTNPLLVSLGRLVDQKGIDWLVEAAPMLIAKGANLVIAGSGDPQLERLVSSLAASFPTAIRYLGYVSDEDARRLLAAADLLLMPSRWEPCGIVQFQAMRYGVVPVARRTGGLADTIVDADERPESANGFLFDEPSGRGLAEAAIRAIERLETSQWRPLQRRGLMAAHGWEGPVQAYEQVYRAALR